MRPKRRDAPGSILAQRTPRGNRKADDNLRDCLCERVPTWAQVRMHARITIHMLKGLAQQPRKKRKTPDTQTFFPRFSTPSSTAAAEVGTRALARVVTRWKENPKQRGGGKLPQSEVQRRAEKGVEEGGGGQANSNNKIGQLRRRVVHRLL